MTRDLYVLFSKNSKRFKRFVSPKFPQIFPSFLHVNVSLSRYTTFISILCQTVVWKRFFCSQKFSFYNLQWNLIKSLLFKRKETIFESQFS